VPDNKQLELEPRLAPQLASRLPSWLTVPLLAVLLLANFAGCSHGVNATQDAESESDVPDSTLGFETKIVDVPVVQEDLGGQSDGAADVTVDVPVPTDVLAVTLASASAVSLGATVTLTVLVDHDVGVDGAPKATEAVTFKVNGQLLAVGATLAAKPSEQSPIAIFATVTAGEYRIAGVRPGTAKLVVAVDGIASPETVLTVIWPDGAFISGATATLSGTAPGKRVEEIAPDTVKITAQLFAPGGVDATLRFPSPSQAGDSYAIGEAPTKGSLSINLVVVTPAGLNQPVTPKEGRLWIDQTDKGYFRGTFLGRALDQSPVVGAFVVERDGNFGVDLLDDPTLVEKSSLVTPESDLHASRVAVNAIGDGKVMLTWRRIKNVTQSELARWIIDAKTGATVTTLPPLVTANVGPWKSAPDASADPCFGSVSAATSNKKTLIAWEGKNGKDGFSAPAPTGIWLRAIASDGTLSTSGPFSNNQPLSVSDDACDGGCHAQLLTLPNARFVVVWSPAAGGIRARRLEGDFTFTDNNPLQIANAPAILSSGATLDATLGLTWRDPSKGAFIRVFSIISSPAPFNSTNQETQVGGKTVDGPAPGLGIFGIGSPGFLAFAIDGSPATNLKVRRFDFSGSAPVGEVAIDSGVDSVRVVSGQDPQIVVLQRASDGTSTTPLRLRKFTTTSPIDGGTQLGPTVDLGAKSSVPLLPALCYVPELDIYVAAWSGDFKSEGVYFQRFR
jgi:hypothetical protein